MSILGPANLGMLNLAGSVAGAQRTSAAEADRTREAAAERSFQIDQKTMSARSLSDVGETDLSPERDADGRLPYGGGPSEPQPELLDEPRCSSDPSGERGRSLDLRA